MIKVLVTGAAGFIGSNLVGFLLERNYCVVGLDNLSTGKLQNLEDYFSNNNFKFVEGDITDFETCIKLVNEVDFVLHQAALGSVPRSIIDPLSTNRVNINGFLNLLEASKISNVKRFIYASSSATYGDSKFSPKVEEIIGNPKSPYGLTKYVNELYANTYSDTYGIEVIGIRYFNVFGPRQDVNSEYAAVIPNFVNKLLNLESPIINGDGSFSRDFTYIDNVLNMNLLCLTTTNSLALNTVFNCAVGNQITIDDVAKKIRSGLSKFNNKIKKIPIVYGPNRKGDIPHSLANIDKAKRLLNYAPIKTFDEGLTLSLNWYVENLKI